MDRECCSLWRISSRRRKGGERGWFKSRSFRTECEVIRKTVFGMCQSLCEISRQISVRLEQKKEVFQFKTLFLDFCQVSCLRLSSDIYLIITGDLRAKNAELLLRNIY